MEIIEFTPSDKLIDQVRNVTMLADKSVYPYKKADITIEDMAIDHFLPTQLYITEDHLEFQNNLREELLKDGYDTLRLYGSILLRNVETIIGMIPPIVEDDHEFGPCLLDGTHRVYLARMLGIKTLSVLHISSVLEDTPMIALPNRWDEIVKYGTMPVNDLKKRRRELPKSKYNYYRDFSNIVGVPAKDARSEAIIEKNVYE
jgi:hypothetical protein